MCIFILLFASVLRVIFLLMISLLCSKVKALSVTFPVEGFNEGIGLSTLLL